MPLLGAHMSVAGGLPRAVDRAIAHGCDAFQIFAKNANQWRGRIVPIEERQEFQTKVRCARLGPVVSHASYLINLATTDPALRARSIEAMGDEIDRADALALYGVVLHPGCFTHGDEAGGLVLVAEALTQVIDERPRGKALVLLEHTAGHGTALGRTFEQLATILARAARPGRLGVCLDTCHLHASGYDLCSVSGYEETFRRFGEVVGFDRLKMFHLNDSKKPLGSRVDRHEHIGRGFLGLEPFRRILNDARFKDLPMLLETPKEERRRPKGAVEVDEHDQRNLATLRGLLDPRQG